MATSTALEHPGNTPCYLLQCPHSALYITALQQLNWTKTHTISPTFQGVSWLFPSVTWLTVYSVLCLKGLAHFLTLILITTPLIISSWYLVTDGSTLATALLGLLVAATASRTCCMSFCRPSCQLVYSSRGRWGCCQHAPCPPSIIPWYIGPVGNDLQWPLCHDCIARSTEILCKNEHRDSLLGVVHKLRLQEEVGR